MVDGTIKSEPCIKEKYEKLVQRQGPTCETWKRYFSMALSRQRHNYLLNHHGKYIATAESCVRRKSVKPG